MRGLIILLCRNGLTYSRSCLETLLKQTVAVEILVVDNASTDGTPSWLRAQQQRHSFIYRMSLPSVEPVAYCWNEGLLWGWRHGHSEALVVNNDTELLPETYARLSSHAAGKIGMLTAVGVDKDPACPGEMVTLRPHPDYSCYLIQRWAHDRVRFDERYKGAYLEDCDHHIRMHRAGIWAGSIDLGFLHRSSGTIKSATAAERTRIDRNYAANRERFLAQYGCLPGTKAYERLFEAATPLTPAG